MQAFYELYEHTRVNIQHPYNNIIYYKKHNREKSINRLKLPKFIREIEMESKVQVGQKNGKHERKDVGGRRKFLPL